MGYTSTNVDIENSQSWEENIVSHPATHGSVFVSGGMESKSVAYR